MIREDYEPRPRVSDNINVMPRPPFRSQPRALPVVLTTTAALLATSCGIVPGTTRTQPVEPRHFVSTDGPVSPPTTEDVSRKDSDDAATPSDPTSPTSTSTSTSATAPATSPRETPTPAEDTPSRPAPRALPTDAMIGQINGQAVYAHQVLAPIDDRLSALARQVRGEAFDRQATQIIYERLRAITVQKLIVGAAEQSLSAEEQQGLRIIVDRKRQELLRQHGQGSPALANATLFRETGQTLDETLKFERDKILVQTYLSRVVRPKINVSRRDVERYYADNLSLYQQQEKRVIRLIIVSDPAGQEQIAAALEAGTPFHEVAAMDANEFNAQDGGAYGDPMGRSDFQAIELADAAFNQEPGHYTGPITLNDSAWFVFTEDVLPGRHQSLDEVQLDIRKKLHDQQVFNETTQHRRKLYNEGSFTDPEVMVERLVAITLARYRPDASGRDSAGR